jgi:hypothetical protein
MAMLKKYLTTKNIIALSVFLISLIVLLFSFQRGVPYWDCGEFIATAATMGVPHPPGAPLFTLIGRIFIMLPFGDNPAVKMNFISVLGSAFTVMFLFLIISETLILWKKNVETLSDKIIVFGSAAIGALAYSFSDSFWFNAVEAEVYASSMFFFSAVVWLGLKWYVLPDRKGLEKYLIFAGYLIGLAIGIHQLSLLAFFFIAWLVYFKETREITIPNFLLFCLCAPFVFFIIYPGIVEWIPSMLDGSMDSPIKITDSEFLKILPLLITLGSIYGIYYTHKRKKKILNIAFISVTLILLGYTTYGVVIFRAHDNPPLNMGNPSTTQSFVDYMERKQYGEQPSILKRRTRQEPEYQKNYKKYTSDFDFFWRYQLGHMYWRYFGWNFIGRAGDIQDAPVVFFKDVENWSKMKGWPQKYYAIPFLIGLLGFFFHFKRDWKTFLAFFSLFLVAGVGLIVFFNVPEPQPRERDYFIVGSFFVFAFWIGVGAFQIAEFIKKASKKDYLAYAGIGVFILAIPFNMLLQNYHTHDRSLNYAAWDSAYNMLQSCKTDAVLFTAGDNDTYPLWYLQNAEGIRRDIRIVNLSLINVDWYIKQQKNDEPFGAKKVPISFSDEEIKYLSESYYSELPPQPVKLPAVPKERWSEFGITDTVQAGSMSITIKPFADFQGKQVIRLQDLMILNILMTNKWERPIYFALSGNPVDRIGLDDYLQMQGMSLEIVPVKRAPGDRFNMNLPIVDKQLLAEHVTPSKDYQPGFIFRNMNNPNINIEEQAQDMIDTYRALYSMTARQYVTSNPEKAKQYINTMSRRFPYEIMPMNFNLLLDIVDMSNQMNDKPLFKYYSDIVEREANKQLISNPNDPETMNILAWIYERRDEYDKALAIYNKFLESNPNDQNLRGRIAYLRTLKDSLKNKVK